MTQTHVPRGVWVRLPLGLHDEHFGLMVELVDTRDLRSRAVKGVRVRVSFSPQDQW